MAVFTNGKVDKDRLVRVIQGKSRFVGNPIIQENLVKSAIPATSIDKASPKLFCFRVFFFIVLGKELVDILKPV